MSMLTSLQVDDNCIEGCVVNQARWSDQWTALHIAAMMGLERIVDVLLSAGADTTMKTSDGLTASQIAVNCHFPGLGDRISRSNRTKIKKEKQIEKVENVMENISIFKPNNLIVTQDSQPKSIQNKNSNDFICDNEEIVWAMQMKKDLEEKEERKKAELDKKRKFSEEENTNKCSKNGEEVKVKRKTQEEKMRELKQKMEEEKQLKENPNISQAEQMVNILDVMEKKRQRRMANKNKLTEKERLEKEQAAVREAMHDEIIWALKIQKEIAEECGNLADLQKYEKQIKEEQEKKDGTWERRIRKGYIKKKKILEIEF